MCSIYKTEILNSVRYVTLNLAMKYEGLIYIYSGISEQVFNTVSLSRSVR